MIRKFILSSIAIVAMTLGAFAPGANAQDTTPTPVVCTTVGYNNCIAYPAGGFTPQSTPVPTATPGPTSAAVVSADTVEATSGGAGSGGGASIAFTGSESRVLGYAGAGLIGFGAIALAVARRKSDTDLD